MNRKLRDIKWHPPKTRLRPGPQTLDKTNSIKNRPQKKKEEPKRNKSFIPKKIVFLKKEPPKILISSNI